MYTLSSQTEILPSLTFTKAELVYALVFLMSDMSNRDNSTRIEMVELRHYLNQVKGQILQAIRDGALDKGLPNVPKKTEKVSSIPSMTELRGKFPNLSDDEILEILLSVKKEQEEKRLAEAEKEVPVPEFIVRDPPAEMKGYSNEKVSSGEKMSKKEKDRENARKFASLLGHI